MSFLHSCLSPCLESGFSVKKTIYLSDFLRLHRHHPERYLAHSCYSTHTKNKWVNINCWFQLIKDQEFHRPVPCDSSELGKSLLGSKLLSATFHKKANPAFKFPLVGAEGNRDRKLGTLELETPPSVPGFLPSTEGWEIWVSEFLIYIQLGRKKIILPKDLGGTETGNESTTETSCFSTGKTATRYTPFRL